MTLSIADGVVEAEQNIVDLKRFIALAFIASKQKRYCNEKALDPL
jgi:hypothetical protein